MNGVVFKVAGPRGAQLWRSRGRQIVGMYVMVLGIEHEPCGS